MNEHTIRRLTGIGFILGAVLINIPYSLLISNFNYPDILRESPETILTAFQAGGSPLILTWLAFAWVGLPLVFAFSLLPRAFGQNKSALVGIATTVGIAGLIAQIVGLLRWVFVVPVLAQAYTDPASSQGTREAIAVVFQAVHQYGGVVIGEHIGYIFTVIWMALVGLAMLRSAQFPRWLGIFGLFAAGIYSLANGELFATVIPGFPYWEQAGLVGSLLWLAWMLVLGVLLVLPARIATKAQATSVSLAARP